jgi:hypothetical protein
MRHPTQQAFVCLGILLTCSCKPAGNDIDKVGETEGVAGLVVPEVDLPEDEAQSVLLASGQCIQFEAPQVFGYVHQCEGSIRLGFEADGQTGEDAFDFGPGETNPLYWIEPDDYDLPLVAACCGPFDYDNPTTEEKIYYANNCLFDAVQQTCHGLPYLLRRQAEQTDNLLRKAALNALATDIENSETECMLELFGAGPSPDTPNRLFDTTWSPKENVTFTLIEAEILDWTEEGEVDWRNCASMFENDPAVIPTAPFEVPGTVAVTNATLLASDGAVGSGPGGLTASFAIATSPSMLTLARGRESALHVTNFLLVADSASRSSDDELSVEHASLVLRNVATARVMRGEWVVDAGSAHFVATVTFQGDSRTVDMTNTSAMVLRRAPTGNWEVQPFELGYDDPRSGSWTVRLGTSTFHPQTR